MGGVSISFNYPNWIALFPNFRHITPAQAQGYFNLATQFCRNDGVGPVEDVGTQTNLLNLLTAHITQIFAPHPIDGQPSNIVGRITNASEGSVSVATEMPMTNTSAWFNQTIYGTAYWAMILPYRTMRYKTAPRRIFDSTWPILSTSGALLSDVTTTDDDAS